MANASLRLRLHARRAKLPLLLPPLLLALVVRSTSAAGSLCFPAPHDANCLSWTVDASNITFSAHFAADASTSTLPVWGAWALPALDCGNMWPANVWLALPSPSGGVRVEDRVATAHAAPACAARAPQLSFTLSSSIAADGSFDVSWTRPLAPPREYRQPDIVAGATPVIGAYALGAAALAFPPCSVAGLPFHANVVNNVAVDFLAADVESPVTDAAAPRRAPAAPAYSGLAGVAAVCGDSCAALAHIDAASGRVTFPSAASPSLYPLLVALDGASRVIHALAYNNSPAGPLPALFVASLSADTGALLGTCATPFSLNDAYDFTNLNFAFDSSSGDVLIASCTDDACVAPLNVTALRPGSCATRVVASFAAEELSAGGSGAVDPYARVLVLTYARGGANPGLVVAAVNVSSGAVVRVTPEGSTPDTPFVQSLAFDDVARVVYGLALTTAGASQPMLVAINARTGKLRAVGAVAGCAGALPNSLAVSDDGERLVFVGAGGEGPTGAAVLYTIFAANGTVAATAPMQGLTIAEAPSALVWLP